MLPATPSVDTAADVRVLLRALEAVGGVAAYAELRAASQLPEERWRVAFSSAQVSGVLIQRADGIGLTPRGQGMIERASEAAAGPKPVPQPTFAELRQAYEASLPAYRQQLINQA